MRGAARLRFGQPADDVLRKIEELQVDERMLSWRAIASQIWSSETNPSSTSSGPICARCAFAARARNQV